MTTRYEIRVRGHLPPSWSVWLGGLEVAHHPDGTTTLTGPLTDQATLHGVLIRLRDLGLDLLAVVSLEEEKNPRQD
jgi:hypothetical protein